MRRAALVLAAGLAGGCGTALGPDPGLEGARGQPRSRRRRSSRARKVVVKGASFVDTQWGDATLRLDGQAGGRAIDLRWPATFVDFGTMTVAVDGGKIDEVGGDVDFAGKATVEIVATSRWQHLRERSDLGRPWRSARSSTPTPSPASRAAGVIFVNDQIQIDGDGFLLGGDEGDDRRAADRLLHARHRRRVHSRSPRSRSR